MKCKFCGQESVTDSSLRGYCGKSQAEKECSICGGIISEEGSVCMFCGNPTDSLEQENTCFVSYADNNVDYQQRANLPRNYHVKDSSKTKHGKNSKAKKNNAPILLGIVFAILLLVTVVGFSVFQILTDIFSVPDDEVVDNRTTQQSIKKDDNKGTNYEKIKEYKVGDKFEFGTYDLDANASNGKEKIEWIVLDKKDDKILVISRYGLDAKPFNNVQGNTTWETSSIRNWLNDYFIDYSFSKDEKDLIVSSSVFAENNSKYGTSSGKSTEDKIFLLSASETEKYFANNSERTCIPSKTAQKNGAVESNGNCWWWLRTSGYQQTTASTVADDGSVHLYGYFVEYAYRTVRPAMWISIK